MAHWLFLPNDAIEDISILSKLHANQIDSLRDLLDSSEFVLRSKFYVRVAETLAIPDEASARICSFINYVQTQRAKNERQPAEVVDELAYFLKGYSAESRANEIDTITKKIREIGPSLTSLFAKLPRKEFSEKKRGLEFGLIPHLDAFRFFCDLRPLYDTDATEILELFPTITMHVVTHARSSDKIEEFLVQLSEDDIQEIKSQIDRLEKKLGKFPKDALSRIRKIGAQP